MNKTSGSRREFEEGFFRKSVAKARCYIDRFSDDSRLNATIEL